METGSADRERAAFDLAERLFFQLKKDGDRYSIRRELCEFVPQKNLNLDEVEEIWSGGSLGVPMGAEALPWFKTGIAKRSFKDLGRLGDGQWKIR